MRQRLSTQTIAGVVVGSVVLVASVVGVVLVSRAGEDAGTGGAGGRSTNATASVSTSRSAEPKGFATPEEAAKAAVPAGYILELAEESQDLQLFWAGPPNSEWNTFLTVEQSDSLWRVTKTEPWSIDEAENGSASAEDAPSSAGAGDAEAVVEAFLTAIQQDRPRDAQKLTIAPLHEDPVSSQVSNGEFSEFAIDDVQPRGEGSFWIMTTETWTYGVETWRYDVVTTRSGLRIRNIEPTE